MVFPLLKSILVVIQLKWHMVVILKCLSLLWTDTFIFFSILNRQKFHKILSKSIRLGNKSMHNFIVISAAALKILLRWNFPPRSCIGILNNTGLDSKENVVLYDTFPSSYVTSLVVPGVAFHHHLPLIVVCYFFASFSEISVWYCDKDPVKI